jgi:lipopolysaccharide/colanic/teichoic acid biosynthesis glycosyltransferase
MVSMFFIKDSLKSNFSINIIPLKKGAPYFSQLELHSDLDIMEKIIRNKRKVLNQKLKTKQLVHKKYLIKKICDYIFQHIIPTIITTFIFILAIHVILV